MIQAHTSSCLLYFVHCRTLTWCLCVCVSAGRSHDSGNEMVEVLESGASHDMVFTSIDNTCEQHGSATIYRSGPVVQGNGRAEANGVSDPPFWSWGRKELVR
jgi:hypothetical protein